VQKYKQTQRLQVCRKSGRISNISCPKSKEKTHHKAARYLRRALAAPLLPGRIIADTGRKSDAKRLLNLITQKLNL